MANPTADWEKVGDRFYRKIQLYTAVFDQDLELENYILTGAAYGGAIGMLIPPLWMSPMAHILPSPKLQWWSCDKALKTARG